MKKKVPWFVCGPYGFVQYPTERIARARARASASATPGHDFTVVKGICTFHAIQKTETICTKYANS